MDKRYALVYEHTQWFKTLQDAEDEAHDMFGGYKPLRIIDRTTGETIKTFKGDDDGRF